jgi:hypothetical protein
MACARAFQLDVTAHSLPVDDFAEKDRPSVPELRHEMPELVAGIRERDGLRTVRNALAREDLNPLSAGEPVGIEAQVRGELRIQPHQPRRFNRGRHDAREEAIRQAAERVLEGEVKGHEGGYVGIVSSERQGSPADLPAVVIWSAAAAASADERPDGWLPGPACR